MASKGGGQISKDKILHGLLAAAAVVVVGGFGLAYASPATSACNVRGIALQGTLYTYIPPAGDEPAYGYEDAVASEEVVAQLWDAERDESVRAILIEVDSGGGYPVAGEEIMNAVREVTKPVVAVVRQMGTSAAYWAISSADRIFASRNSDIGSIGVTASYFEYADENARYIDLSSGRFKDTGNPNKPLTDEERKLLLRDIQITHENFVEDVARSRNIPIEKVQEIADGSSVMGKTAKELGLIDAIGSWTAAQSYLEETLGTDVEVCW